jgi:hypothetical protein
MKIKEILDLDPLNDGISLSHDHYSAFRTSNTTEKVPSNSPKPSAQSPATLHGFNTATAAQQTADSTSQPPPFSSYNPQTKPSCPS